MIPYKTWPFIYIFVRVNPAPSCVLEIEGSPPGHDTTPEHSLDRVVDSSAEGHLFLSVLKTLGIISQSSQSLDLLFLKPHFLVLTSTTHCPPSILSSPYVL